MFATTDIFLFMLILIRMAGCFLYIPFISHRSIPLIAKAGFSAAFALIVFPLVDTSVAIPDSFLQLLLLMSKELVVGLAMGFAVRMFFFMVDFASHILTVEVGLMPGAEFDPTMSRGGNPMGTMMYFLAMVVILSGSEYDILRAYLSSYEVAPIGYTVANAYAGETIVEQSAGIFKIGILMSAPVIAVNFLVNMVFAVLGKVVPKLNVFILSFSARILAGISIFSFTTMEFLFISIPASFTKSSFAT